MAADTRGFSVSHGGRGVLCTFTRPDMECHFRPGVVWMAAGVRSKRWDTIPHHYSSNEGSGGVMSRVGRYPDLLTLAEGSDMPGHSCQIRLNLIS
ncbi:hypothetical protein DPMN_009459 [Dreissena polymorpha]|uniref:Uncharacterized protein n=1 Tax=Dreissena polymorpha TaxID=45954 RepID=A0A9D4S030_DREPO|nr:hypothetical protein DPMN_009459 [Dreissena polymorpha]